MAKPCIEHTQKPSYGFIYVNGKSVRLHVHTWEQTHGRNRPDGYEIHHKCENKRCIEPTHLVALTKSDHVRLHKAGKRKVSLEVAERIRAEHASLPRAERRPRKERTLKSPEGGRLAPGAQVALAAKYGITVNYLKTILRGPRLTGPVPDIGDAE